MSTFMKTPVSLLQELARKENKDPEYQVVDQSEIPNEPRFVIEVRYEKYSALAEARTKKAAKHIAAQKMLDILKNNSIFNGDDVKVHVAETKTPQLSYENKFTKDAVSPLKDFCIEYQLPEAVYHEIREEGPSHARMFTQRCTIDSIAVESTEKLKKHTKQQVSLQMLNFIKNVVDHRDNIKVSDVESFKFRNEKDGEDFQTVAERLTDCKTNLEYKIMPGDLVHPFMIDYQRYNQYNKIVEALKEFSHIEDKAELLNLILQEAEITYGLVPISCSEENMVMLTLSIKTAPAITVSGVADSYILAFEKVTQKALKYLQLLCFNVIINEPPSDELAESNN